jgi:cobalt/nickel transport system ATP-binding protein
MKLRFNKICYSYQGITEQALDDVSMELQMGEKIAMIGRNGSGKSTLMMIANGILQPQSGELILDEQPVQYDRKSLLNLRQNVGVVFQNPEDQLFSASVYQDLSLGPLNMGLTVERAQTRVEEVAELCGLTGLMHRPTHALSSGEKTRAALAGVLAMEPQFLFADEVTNSLDPWMRSQVLHILSNWVERGHTVILATHDWSLAGSWAQRVIWMDQGRIFRQGTPAEVFTGQDLPEGVHNHV